MAEREELPVRGAREQDPAAWDRLFKRYQTPLFVYVFELVRNEQSSLDIVQETFISAVRYIGSLRDDDKFGSWLFGIAYQKCLQQWRKDNRAEAALQEFAEVPAAFDDAPDDLLISQEQQEEFMQVLNELPLAQRSVLLLHYIEDFSIEEIAKVTGVTEGTVKSRLHYARKTIRKLWEDK